MKRKMHVWVISCADQICAVSPLDSYSDKEAAEADLMRMESRGDCSLGPHRIVELVERRRGK